MVPRVRLRGDNLLLGLVACLHHLHAGFVPSLQHSCECPLLRLPCGRCASTRIEQLLLRSQEQTGTLMETVWSLEQRLEEASRAKVEVEHECARLIQVTLNPKF